MKRKAKRKNEEVNIPALRQDLYAKHQAKLHPIIKKNLEADGVLEAVCNGLVDHELQDRRMNFPTQHRTQRPEPDIRLLDGFIYTRAF